MNTVSDELLPCPFCGGTAAKLISGGPGNCFVACDGCGANTDDGSAERVTAAWNRRASIPGGVGVKGLDWEEDDAKHYTASASGIIYTIFFHDNIWKGYTDGWALWTLDPVRSLEEAKAAAQADYERRILSALDLSSAEGKSDRDMRDGMDCNYPDCGCCFDSKCSDAPDAAPSNPVISDERIDEPFAAHVMRLISKAEQMVGYADLTSQDAQVAWTEWRDERIHVLRLATAALSVKPQSGETK